MSKSPPQMLHGQESGIGLPAQSAPHIAEAAPGEAQAGQ